MQYEFLSTEVMGQQYEQFENLNNNSNENNFSDADAVIFIRSYLSQKMFVLFQFTFQIHWHLTIGFFQGFSVCWQTKMAMQLLLLTLSKKFFNW